MAVVTGESAAELLAAGAALHADAVAAEAVAALSAIGIASILLRGRVIAHHLYDSGEIRSYADADLLIQVRNRERAEGTLRNLGYAHVAVLGQGHIVGVGTMNELAALDDPLVHEYFYGPRGRAAREQAWKRSSALPS